MSLRVSKTDTAQGCVLFADEAIKETRLKMQERYNMLSCIGWAGDLTPMGSEGHIRLNRTRVAPNPQGMGEPRGFHQETEVSSAPTQ